METVSTVESRPAVAVQTTAVTFDPFAGPEILRLAPLTEPQAEILAACLLGGDDASRGYNESVSLRFTGGLNQPALRRALQAVGQRHEALRSVFAADGRAICILRELPIALQYQDLAAEPAAVQELRVAACCQQETSFAFDLVQGPLLRAVLLRLSPTEHQLVLTAHHIICDGWSMALLLQDLGKYYSAYCLAGEPELPPATPFSAYADQQLQFSRTPAYRATEQFWLAQYQGPVPVLNLPTDFPRPARRTYRSARADYLLRPELVSGLKKIGLSVGCSFVSTLLAAFEVFLHQLTGQAEVVVGLPAAGQAATGLFDLVGHCVNLLPLRSAVPADASFPAYLRHRKPAIFDAYEHQQFTFGSLLKMLRIPRDNSRVPLVPVVFNIDLGLADGVGFYGLTYRLKSNPRAFETFELFLNASGSEQHLTLEWSYNTALFKAETIDQLMARFEALIGGIVARPTARLLAAPAPAAPELPEVYKALNATERAYPAQTPLHQLLAEQAARTPEALAVQFKNETLTYQQLNQQANQLAHYLVQLGVQPADRVAVAVERSPALLVALLASMKCGATYVPLDPTYPAERLAFMLADSAATLVLASARLAAVPAGTSVVLMEEALSRASDCPVQSPDIELNADALLYVLYTSGSTGQPKGVQVSHRNVVNFLTSMQQEPGIVAGDRLLAVTTISFDIAGLELFLPLMCGATVVLADTLATKDGRELLRLLRRERITLMQATPATWRMMLDAGWDTTPDLKILCGGEALPAELATRLLAKSRSVWNLYGPTETTIWSAVKQLTDSETGITIGRPIANTQLYVLDEQRRPVAAGVVGELWIGGDGVAHGYLNRPELTAEKFIPNPFASAPGARLYRTGDLGQLLPSGELQCLGRLDQQVKIRGFRIELGELEHHLAGFGEVKEAVVVADTAQPGHERLVAYVVPARPIAPADAPLQIDAWRQALRQKVPAFMVPADFFIMSELPLTLNGKINRQALLQQLGERTGPATGFEAPRTANEKVVAAIWQACLGTARIGRFDNFFELGGHSLIAVQVMARIESETGIRLPLAALFEQPTVSGLAALLQAGGNEIPWSSLVPIKPGGTRPPLYLVHGAGLNILIFNAVSKGMDADQPVYGLQAKGLNGIDTPHDSVEAMAAHYIAAILEHNPTGPYALAGYSFGGIIAFEMARQLQAAGKEVKFLGLFDTYAEQPEGTASGLKNLFEMLYTSARQWFYRFVSLKNNPRTTLTLKAESLKKTGAEMIDRVRYSKPERYQKKYGHPYELEIAQSIAKQNYYLTPQPIAIHLFRSTQRMYYMSDFEFMGWKPFALGGIATYDLPGNHYYMFAPPNDKESARILQNALNNC